MCQWIKKLLGLHFLHQMPRIIFLMQILFLLLRIPISHLPIVTWFSMSYWILIVRIINHDLYSILFKKYFKILSYHEVWIQIFCKLNWRECHLSHNKDISLVFFIVISGSCAWLIHTHQNFFNLLLFSEIFILVFHLQFPLYRSANVYLASSSHPLPYLLRYSMPDIVVFCQKVSRSE